MKGHVDNIYFKQTAFKQIYEGHVDNIYFNQYPLYEVVFIL